MKYCAFFLRENFTKTFFVFVFILLGFFAITQSAFGAITETTWKSTGTIPTGGIAPVGGSNQITTTHSGYKLNDKFYSQKNLIPPGDFKEGLDMGYFGKINSSYSLGTVASDGTRIRTIFKNQAGIFNKNTTDDSVESVQVWTPDGKFYDFKSGKIDSNGNLTPLGPTERVYKNVQENNGVFNARYTDEYRSLLSNVQDSLSLQFNNNQSLTQSLDLKNSESRFIQDWEKTLYKINEDPSLSQSEKDAIFNAFRASYANTATEEQKKLLEKTAEGNEDIIKKTQEGGQDKWVAKTYDEEIKEGKTPEQVSDSAAKRNGGDNGICFDVDYTGIDLNLANCIEQGLYYLMYILSLVLALVGIVFNWVFEFTVVEMSKNIKGLSIINAAWEVFRDLANILFIFLLLYLSIQTILQTDGGEVKHTLSKLIIVALLLNFSLFFTKVIIDSSNILTITIYEKVKPSDGKLGLADAFMSVFQFQELYKQPGMTGFNNSGDIDLSLASKNFAGQQYDNAWTTFIMGSIMIIIATFVFASVIVIFLSRFVILILLMVTAPLAFVASIFPKTSGMAEEMWWGNLIKNAFYAPLFMVFIWISLKILTEDAFIGTVKGSDVAIIPIIVGFVVAIAFLLISLIAAESLHVAGAHTAMKWYGGMQGWLGANTVGRAVYNLLEKGDSSHYLYQTAAEGRRSKVLDKLSNVPFIGGAAKWTQDRYVDGTKKGARLMFDKAHHVASSDFSSIPFVGGGHGDHGGGDHKAGGYAKKVQEDADRQKNWWNEQKGNPEAWSEVFEKVDAQGKTHEGKVLERASENWEDKVELVQSMKFRIDDLQEEYDNEQDAGKKAKIKVRLDRVKDWQTHLMGGEYKGAQKGTTDGRFTAKEQDRVNKGIEGPTINHRSRFDKLGAAMITNKKSLRDLDSQIASEKNTDAKDRLIAEKNQIMNSVQKTRDYYKKLNPKQKVGLRVDQYTNGYMADLNVDSNIFEQAQREAKMTPEATDMFGKIGFSAETRDKAYKDYQKARESGDITKLRDSEKKLFKTFKPLGEFYQTQLNAIDSAPEGVTKEVMKNQLIEEYAKTRAKSEAKLGIYFEKTGERWYDRPEEYPAKAKDKNKPEPESDPDDGK